MSHAELVELRAEIDRLIADKQASEKVVLRQQLAELARAKGFSLEDVVGKSRKRGAVPIKYRDPKNPENTWTGRGRTPRWMVAATKGGRAKKDDFLV
ncbi:MAG: H-NS histone family protein [Hyphomicrobiaceae bacterium]|nr:H-NS histone family protein [Hyphomicrobiaceae bacterium]